MKEEVDLYNSEKHKMPCWKCKVKKICFSEKKATKRAKYLKYTIELKKPCIEAILTLLLIKNTAKRIVAMIEEEGSVKFKDEKGLVISLKEKDEWDNANLFNTDCDYFNYPAECFLYPKMSGL
jgi:hypothetical protein